MAERKSTLGSRIVEAFKKMDERAQENARRIQTPSGDPNIAAETLVAIGGLMAGIWGGNNAIAMVKPGFDSKSVFMKAGVKAGLSTVVQLSDKIMTDIIKNDKHIFSKAGGEEALKVINNIDKNLTKNFKLDGRFQSSVRDNLKDIKIILKNIKEDINGGIDIDEVLKKNDKYLQKHIDKIIEQLENKSDKLEINLTSNDADSLAEVLDKVSDPSYDMETFADFISGMIRLSEIKNLKAIDEDINKIVDTLHKLIEVIPSDNKAGEDIELAVGNLFNSIQRSLTEGAEKLNEEFKVSFDEKKILEPFYSLFDAIREVNEHQVTLDISSIVETIHTLEKDLKFDQVKTSVVHQNIREMVKILKDVENIRAGNTLSELFSYIHQIVGEGGKVGSDTQSLTRLLTSITDFLQQEIDPRNARYAKQGISVLVEIFDPKKGQIKKLFADIEELQKEHNVNLTRSLENLRLLFNAISGVASLSPVKMMEMKFNISFLEDYMMRDIIKVMKQIGSLDDNVAHKDAHLAIENLNTLFDAVTKLGEIDSHKRGTMFTNLKFIKFFLLNDIMKLMDDIAESGMGTWGKKEILDDKKVDVLNARTKAVQNASIALGNINGIFDLVTKLGEIDPKSRNRMNRNFRFLKYIITKEIVDLLQEIAEIKNINNAVDKTQMMSQLLTDFTSMFENVPSMMSLVKNFLKMEIIKENALLYGLFVNKINALKITKKTKQNWKDLNTILSTIAEIKSGFTSAKDIAKTINELNKAAEKMALIGKLESGVEAANTVFEKIIDIVKNTVDKLNEIEKDKIEQATNTLNAFANLVIKSAAILIFGAALTAIIAPKALLAFTVSLGLFVMGIVGVYGWASKYLHDTYESARGLALIVMASGATLILGGLMMKVVDPGSLVLFTATLGLFIMGIVGTLGLFGKRIQDSGDTLLNFAALVLVSGGILMLGGLMMTIIDPEQLGRFALTLGLFIAGVTLPLLWLAPVIKNAFEGLRDFTVFVAVSGAIMLFAAVLGDKIPFWSLLGFAFNMGIFVLAMVSVFAVGSWISLALGVKDPFKEALLGLRDFALLILASGAVMIFATLVADHINFLSLLAFSANLALFILMTTGAYALTSKFIDGAIDDAKQFGLLLLFSAAVMIFGGMFFTWFPEIIPGTFLFAAILGGFMMAVGLGIMLASKFIEKGQKTIIEMAILVVLSGALMLFAGWVMTQHPGIKKNIWQFVLADLVLVGGMALIVAGLSKLKSGILQGILTLGAIILITALSAYVMGMVGDFSKKTDWGDLMNGIGKIDAALLALGGSYWAFGYLFFLDGGLGLGLATLALGAINGLTLLTVYTMKKVMVAAKEYDAKKMEKFKLAIKDFGELGKTLASEFTGWWTLKLPIATAAVASLGITLSIIAKAVEEYANLKVAIYEGTKVVGYRQLKDKDFASAAKNVQKIISTLGGAVISAYERNPEIFGADASILGIPVGKTKFEKVAKSLAYLGPMLAKIAEGVKEYADMKIALYDGTKKIGYRHLEDADFQAAATNVKHIIEVLGKAVIDTYDENPEIFEEPLLFGSSKFSKVAKSLSKLGPMISTIAKGVKEYADLKVGEDYKQNDQGFLVATKYRHLTDDDFINAAANVKHIISTLSGAIIEVYEEHPDYYEEKGGFLGFGGSSPFARTIKANMKLANLISNIAGSVKDYADMKVGEDYKPNKDGFLLPTKYRHLEKKDFEDAASNVKIILHTLGGAIIELYNESNGIYDEGDGFLGIGASSSPFARTIKANMKLANLISKIAGAVKDYANFTVGEDYKKDDKLGIMLPTKYRHLDRKDFQAAADNVKLILNTLGGAIVELAEEDAKRTEPLYEKGFWGGDSKFVQVIKANMKLAELISSIGTSVKDLASGNVVTEWDDKTGKPKKYEQLSGKHFKAAAENVKLIITTLGQAIMRTYNDHEDWFDDGEDSAFAQACNAIGTMGNMINNIAQGIQAYADLKVPIYGEGGKITGYDKITDKMFSDAATNIGKLVSTLGKTVIEIYNEHEDWFDDGADSDFAMACVAIGSMGDMLGKIATGLQSYAELKFPIKWDEQGNPVDFKVLQDSDFENASKHIAQVVSTLGETIMGVYNKNPKMFEVDPEKHPDSIFAIVIEGCTMMGDMIASIAEGIQAYAELKMPTGFDKNGKPTGYKKLDESIFGQATKNIGTIISTIGGAIDATFYEHKDWFEHRVLKKAGGFLGMSEVEEPDPNDPPFIAAMNGITMMGAMISSIAKGIQDYANLDMPLYDSTGKIIGRQKLNDGIFTEAANNISTIITIIGQTINDVYDKHSVLFIGDNAKKITKACTEMGKMISAISKGIQAYANLSYPTKWNDKGIATEYQKLTDQEIKDAAATIKTVLTTIGEAVNETAKNEIFNSYSLKKAENMMTVMQKTGSTVTTLAKTVKAFATMTFDEYDYSDPKKPKLLKRSKLSGAEISVAIENIGKVITTIGQAIVDTVDGNEKLFGKNILESPAYMAAVSVGKIGQALNTIATSIGYYAKGRFPNIIWKDGKLTTSGYWYLGDKEYAQAKIAITKVVTSIGEALASAYNEHPELFELDQQNKKSVAQKVVDGIKIMTESLKTASESVVEMSKINIGDVQSKLTGTEASLRTAIGTIIEMFAILTQDKAEERETFVALTGQNAKYTINEPIGEWMKKKEKTLGQTVDGISNLSSALTTIAEALKTVPDPSVFNDVKFTDIEPKFSNIITTFAKILDPIQNGRDLTKYENVLFGEMDVLDMFIDRIQTVIDSVSTLDSNSLTTLAEIVGKYLGIVATLRSVFDTENKNNTGESLFGQEDMFASFQKHMSKQELEDQIKFFGDNIERIIDLADLSEEVGPEGLDHISTGVSKIDQVMQNIRGIENFQKHNKQMDDYVTTVNKLQVQKIDKLTGLVKAMHQLANKMGNVDQLTSAIADQLAGVLDRLVNEMKTAEKIIKESEVIQKKRHDMIERSVNNVKDIMKQKLVVEISQVQDTTGLGGGGGGTTGGGSTENPEGGNTGGTGAPAGGITPTTTGNQGGGGTTPTATVTPVDRTQPVTRGNAGGGINPQYFALLQQIKSAVESLGNKTYKVMPVNTLK